MTRDDARPRPAAPSSRPCWLAGQSTRLDRPVDAAGDLAPRFIGEPRQLASLIMRPLMFDAGAEFKPPGAPCAARRLPLLEELEEAALGARQIFARARPLHAVQRIARALLGRLDQRRVDIGFAADRRRVAERLGDRLDHRGDADPLRPPPSPAIARRR